MISFFSKDVKTTYSNAYNMMFCAAEITAEDFSRLVYSNKEMLLEMDIEKRKSLSNFLLFEEEENV